MMSTDVKPRLSKGEVQEIIDRRLAIIIEKEFAQKQIHASESVRESDENLPKMAFCQKIKLLFK